MAPLRVILAAGGTGGHLWPALSVAQALKRLEPEADFLFIGAGRPLEATILDPWGVRRVSLKSSGLKGMGLAGKVRGLWRCLTGTGEAFKIFRDYRPDLCFGAGGYVTVPAGLAAKLSGTPLVIHEQNSRAGLSNRFLGKLAQKVLVAFAEAAPAFGSSAVTVTGNPLRPEIAALHGLKRDYRDRPLTVAVTGGSQGAAAVNRVVLPALLKLHQGGLDFSVLHQSGAADLDWLQKEYSQAGLKAEVAAYFQDMASFYRRADLLIGRAGAITVSELAAAGLPSILVPLPTAADNHQLDNARHLEQAGAALVFEEKNLSPEILATALGDCLNDPARLEAMSRAASGATLLGADEHMARICLNLIRRPQNKPEP